MQIINIYARSTTRVVGVKTPSSHHATDNRTSEIPEIITATGNSDTVKAGKFCLILTSHSEVSD
jgi:hypothetical protein